MKITRIGGNLIPLHWEWIEQLLRPAIARDVNRTTEQVKDALVNGTMGLAALNTDDGVGLVVIEPVGSELWVAYLVASVPGSAWLRTIRDGMGQIASSAQDAGFTAICLGGRDWSRVLPDFERYDSAYPNRLRKVLA